MVCKHCNAEISEGSKFCTSCGKSLEDIELAEGETAELAEISADSLPAENTDGDKEADIAERSGDDPVLIDDKSFDTAAVDLDKTETNINNGYLPETEETAAAEENSGNSFDAVYSAPSAAPADGGAVYLAHVTVKPSKKRPKAGKGQTVIVSVLLGLLIFVFVFACESLMLARSVFVNGSVSSAVAKINPSEAKIGKLLQSEGIKSALEEMGADISVINDDTTVGEFLASLSVDIPMKGEDVEALLEETDIMEEISAVAADYEYYLVTGQGGDYLSAKKLLSIIYSHRSDILKYTGVDISEYSDKLEETIDGMKADIKDLNAENALGSLGRMSYILLNPVTIIGTAILSLVFTAVIITVTRRPFAALLTLGIGSALSGLIFFLTAVFHPLIISLCVPYGDDLEVILTKLFRISIFNDMLGISLIFLGTGAVFIAIKAVQNSIIKRKERRMAAQRG